jgi:hypothetical protein
MFFILDAGTSALLGIRHSETDAELFVNNTAATCDVYEVDAKPIAFDDSEQKAVEAENGRRAMEPGKSDIAADGRAGAPGSGSHRN